MKGVYVVSITAVVILMFLYQWPKIKSTEKNEKAAFAAITGIGWAAAVLYIIFPNASSPAKIFDFIVTQVRSIILT